MASARPRHCIKASDLNHIRTTIAPNMSCCCMDGIDQEGSHIILLPSCVHHMDFCAEHSLLDQQSALVLPRTSRRTCSPKVYTPNQSPKLIATLACELSDAIASRMNSWLHFMLCCTLTRLRALRLVDETLHHLSMNAASTTLVQIRPPRDPQP